MPFRSVSIVCYRTVNDVLFRSFSKTRNDVSFKSDQCLQARNDVWLESFGVEYQQTRNEVPFKSFRAK